MKPSVAAQLLFAILFQGMIGFIFLFRTPSEPQNAVLFGLSALRLAIAGGMLLLLGITGWLALLAARSPGRFQVIGKRMAAILGAPPIFALVALSAAAAVFSLAGFILAYTPVIAQRLGMLPVVFRHIQALAAWIGLSGLQIAVFAAVTRRAEWQAGWQDGKWSLGLALSLLGGLAASAFFALSQFLPLAHRQAEIRHFYTLWMLWMLAVFGWSWLNQKLTGQSGRLARVNALARPLLIFLTFLVLYQASALAVGNAVTPAKSYFNDLAYAFLDGRLYLEDPAFTMDLTFFEGNWYVAFPPLAALLMLPLALLNGPDSINTVRFTIFFSAANTALVFVMLQEIARRGWSRLREMDNLWLTVLFGLSTIHWYSAFNGKVWYISRLLALTFMLLAVVLVLKRKSPWLVGLAIGLTVWARPNTVFIYPFLLGVRWQDLLDGQAFQFKKLVPWAAATAVPVVAAVVCLLGYNQLRFGDWLDFGYATMNVGVNNEVLKAYGQFNPAFIPFNLYYMWASLPYFSDSCFNRLVPNPQGISLLLTTPAMIYLLKSFRKTIWVAGAWAAVLLQVGLLSLHTGSAWEFGYRFLLDFIIPVMALIAVGAGSRVSWLLRGLILAGVAVNLWGVLWYYDILCFVL